MSKAEKTREYIIEKSSQLFNKKGYGGTSLTDIIEVTGLTKGSIYGNFANKDEVAIAVYQYNIGRVKQKFAEAMNVKVSAKDKLIAFTDYYRTNWTEFFEYGGCPIQNAAIECDDQLPFLRKHVQDSLKDMAGGLAAVIELGQKRGEFKKHLNRLEYAYEILGIVEGGIMIGKIQNNHKMLFNALDRIVTIINNELTK